MCPLLSRLSSFFNDGGDPIPSVPSSVTTMVSGPRSRKTILDLGVYTTGNLGPGTFSTYRDERVTTPRGVSSPSTPLYGTEDQKMEGCKVDPEGDLFRRNDVGLQFPLTLYEKRDYVSSRLLSVSVLNKTLVYPSTDHSYS